MVSLSIYLEGYCMLKGIQVKVKKRVCIVVESADGEVKNAMSDTEMLEMAKQLAAKATVQRTLTVKIPDAQDLNEDGLDAVRGIIYARSGMKLD